MDTINDEKAVHHEGEGEGGKRRIVPSRRMASFDRRFAANVVGTAEKSWQVQFETINEESEHERDGDEIDRVKEHNLLPPLKSLNKSHPKRPIRMGDCKSVHDRQPAIPLMQAKLKMQRQEKPKEVKRTTVPQGKISSRYHAKTLSTFGHNRSIPAEETIRAESGPLEVIETADAGRLISRTRCKQQICCDEPWESRPGAYRYGPSDSSKNIQISSRYLGDESKLDNVVVEGEVYDDVKVARMAEALEITQAELQALQKVVSEAPKIILVDEVQPNTIERKKSLIMSCLFIAAIVTVIAVIITSVFATCHREEGEVRGPLETGTCRS